MFGQFRSEEGAGDTHPANMKAEKQRQTEHKAPWLGPQLKVVSTTWKRAQRENIWNGGFQLPTNVSLNPSGGSAPPGLLLTNEAL